MTFKDKEKEIKKFLKKIKGVHNVKINKDYIDFFDNDSERHCYYNDEYIVFFKLFTNYSTLYTAKIVVKVIEFLKTLGFGVDE